MKNSVKRATKPQKTRRGKASAIRRCFDFDCKDCTIDRLEEVVKVYRNIIFQLQSTQNKLFNDLNSQVNNDTMILSNSTKTPKIIKCQCNQYCNIIL